MQNKPPASRNTTLLTIASLAVAGLVTAWCVMDGQAAEDRAAITDTPQIQTTVVADALEFPWSVAFLPDDAGFLVTERDGRLLHISQDGKTRHEISGLPAHLFAKGQGGLFDITLAPDYAESKQVYFAFAGGTADANNTELAMATLDIAAHALRDVKVIFKAEPKTKGAHHYGGRILFTKDGHILLTLGDRYTQRDRAQTTDSHLGKIVRLMPDGSAPKDNPFVGTAGAKAEVYTMGNRNMQGIAIYPANGDIWFHEHGPRGGDEVNILKAGANYGWPVVTYGHEYSGLPITDLRHKDGMEDAIVQWTPSIAPSGMAFYTGDQLPQWKGDLFVGALAGQHLRRLDIEGGRIIKQERLLTDLESRIRDVRNGPDGYLYILTDGPEGQLIKLERKR